MLHIGYRADLLVQTLLGYGQVQRAPRCVLIVKGPTLATAACNDVILIVQNASHGDQDHRSHSVMFSKDIDKPKD